jgi:hypothetical protein
MRRFHVLVGPVLLAAATAIAQQNSDPVSLSGTVVNSATGEPMPFVRVVLYPEGNERLTDVSGNFLFLQIAPGDHSVVANKIGFTQAEGHENGYSLSLTASLEKFKVGLTPLSSIRGRITDTDGESVEGVTVLTVQSKVEAGHRQNRIVAEVTTDDRGEYRVSLLPAGEYLIEASG